MHADEYFRSEVEIKNKEKSEYGFKFLKWAANSICDKIYFLYRNKNLTSIKTIAVQLY